MRFRIAEFEIADWSARRARLAVEFISGLNLCYAHVMSNTPKPPVGSISWCDLTVPDAGKVRDFYSAVVGWTAAPLSMGDYEDYCMNRPGSDETVAGICHARGVNAKIPPQWMMYITVADVEASARRCVELGGKVLDGPRPLSGGHFCVIRDPAGAVAALFQH